MSKTITIYMDAETLELLDKTADNELRSRSNLVRKMLSDYVKSKDKKENNI